MVNDKSILWYGSGLVNIVLDRSNVIYIYIISEYIIYIFIYENVIYIYLYVKYSVYDVLGLKLRNNFISVYKYYYWFFNIRIYLIWYVVVLCVWVIYRVREYLIRVLIGFECNYKVVVNFNC